MFASCWHSLVLILILISMKTRIGNISGQKPPTSVLEADLYVVKIVAGERGKCACRNFLGIYVAIAQNKVLYVK